MFSKWQRWLLLAGFALLVALRLPHTWAHGRFQDEEATVFLAYAWHRPWLDALLRPFAGYWNLAANATTLLVASLVKAGAVPLERAPYLTMTMALAVQMMPAVLILTSTASWLRSRLAVIGSLLMIAIAPSTEEVFLNVLHIQFHLALCAALILALDAPRRRIAQGAYGALLLLAPLCGPVSIVLLPLFALRALLDRDRRRLGQLAALAVGAAIQMLLFYGPSPLRGHLLDPGTLAATLFVRLLALPALGMPVARVIGFLVWRSEISGGHGWWIPAASAVALFGLLAVQAARRNDGAVWLVLACLSIASASFGFGMIMLNGFAPFDLAAERYDFLPLVLLGLGLIALAMRERSPGRPVHAALCLLMLCTGALHYTKPFPAFAQGPSWPAEVRAWRLDHRHALAVWPQPWAADLSDQARSCSPPGRDPAASTDPRYCESGWAAGFYRRATSR